MLDQAWKMAAPYLPGRLTRREFAGPPRTAIQAVREADLVVASGGGYVTDTVVVARGWRAEPAVALAQRLGKPTAMFGQGIGPMQRACAARTARGVAPGLAVFGLRDDRTGAGVSLGAPAAMVASPGTTPSS